MTTRINLLPWREERRQQQQRSFLMMLGGIVAVAAAGVFGAHLYVTDMIEHQERRNQYLKDEIAKLDKIEREINEMKNSEDRLRARLAAIQKLQRGRPGMVKVLDSMVRRLPEDIYLQSFKAEGPVLTMRGNARINNVVSDFMRELEQSPLFGEPKLKIVENKVVFEEVPTSEFELTVSRAAQPDNSGKEGTVQ